MSSVIYHKSSHHLTEDAPLRISFVVYSCSFYLLLQLHTQLLGIEINSGTNALNVSIILGIMALPTIVSVSEDALQATGRDLREDLCTQRSVQKPLLKPLFPLH